MRSLFIAMVFSFLALGCGNNQFVPNDNASTANKVDSQGADSITLAEDGEYQVITPESLSSGGEVASLEKAKKLKMANEQSIPPEVFEDPDFGTSRAGRNDNIDTKSEDVSAETPKSSETPKEDSDWATIPQDEAPSYPVPENKDKEEEDDSTDLPNLDVVKESDISTRGMLRPTVYYYPVINEDKRKCEKDYILRDEEGEKMISLCEKTRASCRLQGSCAIVQNGKKRTFNIIGNYDGKDRFFETSKDVCRFGFGVKSSCLDPFYTVAADLSIYRPGDVIYVPKVRGTLLPDGSKHSGYFIVRDRGRNIIGKTRFDFYTGHISWRDEENPFSKIGLASKSNKFEFMKIKGAKAKAFSQLRSYPKLPVATVKH